MENKLSEKEQAVERSLLLGESQRKIAYSMGISEANVQKIKARLPCDQEQIENSKFRRAQIKQLMIEGKDKTEIAIIIGISSETALQFMQSIKEEWRIQAEIQKNKQKLTKRALIASQIPNQEGIYAKIATMQPEIIDGILKKLEALITTGTLTNIYMQQVEINLTNKTIGVETCKIMVRAYIQLNNLTAAKDWCDRAIEKMKKPEEKEKMLIIGVKIAEAIAQIRENEGIAKGSLLEGIEIE